jgi:aryl-alcohol dehydrogenase-like predicted oxidoreductase
VEENPATGCNVLTLHSAAPQFECRCDMLGTRPFGARSGERRRRAAAVRKGATAMMKRPFGGTGIEVSALGLGCNNFGGRLAAEKSKAVVHAALDAGITFIDTADVYGNRGGSETVLGAVLGGHRKEVFLSTKFGIPMDDEGRLKGGSRAYVMRAIEASLRRLRTDWVDVYYVHRPDPETPIEETLAVLDDLKRQGKARFAGCSNFSGPQLAEALEIAGAKRLAPFVAAQDEYSLLSRGIEPELLPAVERHGLALIPYFPLASGLLTGKYRKGQPVPPGTRLAGANFAGARFADRFLNDDNLEIVERLAAFCSERGRTLLELAFAWLLAKPHVATVIAGATSPEQVRQNAAALGWQLAKDDIAAVVCITARSNGHDG